MKPRQQPRKRTGKLRSGRRKVKGTGQGWGMSVTPKQRAEARKHA